METGNPIITSTAGAAPTFHDLAERIASSELPSFGVTLQDVLRTTEAAMSSGQQVAEVILRDPALTSRVLRAANAARLGLSGNARVATVSRAVVVLGLNPIRSLCVSAMAVEVVVGASRFRQRVQRTLGHALHAAVQARDIALKRRLDRATAERLFVEALLEHIGELAFWCFGEGYAERLDAALEAGDDPEHAQTAILGTSLRQFGRGLLHAWNLDTILQGGEEVALARRLGAAGEHGWNTAEARHAAHAVARFLGQTDHETLTQLANSAREAARLANELGVGSAARHIPAPADAPGQASASHADPAPNPDLDAPMEPAPDPVPAFPAPDLQQQLRTLAELGCVATSRAELPLVLEACLEGMHRAVGLDRCAFCLLNPERTRIVARMVVGLDADALRLELRAAWSPEQDSVWRAHAPHWCIPPDHTVDFLAQTAEQRAFFIAPFMMDQKLVGVFYGDRRPSGRPLDAALLESFGVFAAQAQIVARGLPAAPHAG